ncbi:MAG: hypothetical protein V8Q76_05585 [Bacteroides intestinalis]
MNYLNPLRGIASMHCSANTNMEGTHLYVLFRSVWYRYNNFVYRPETSSVMTNTDG